MGESHRTKGTAKPMVFINTLYCMASGTPTGVVSMSNAPCSLTYLNTWSQLVRLPGEAMETLGGIVLLEEVFYWGRL